MSVYWVVIGRRIFLFHDLLLFAIFTHQNIVFQDGRSHHKDSVRSHIHKVTVLQKKSGSCVAVDDTIYVNCVSVFCDRCFVNKKWIRICNHHDVKCYKFVKYIPCHLGEKILLMYITYWFTIIFVFWETFINCNIGQT